MNLTARLPEVASLIFNETFNGGSATPAYDKGELTPAIARARACSLCLRGCAALPPRRPGAACSVGRGRAAAVRCAGVPDLCHLALRRTPCMLGPSQPGHSHCRL